MFNIKVLLVNLRKKRSKHFEINPFAINANTYLHIKLSN